MNRSTQDTISKGLKDVKNNIEDMRKLLNPTNSSNKLSNRYDTNNRNTNFNFQPNIRGKYSCDNQRTGLTSRYQNGYLRNTDTKPPDHHRISFHNYDFNKYNDNRNKYDFETGSTKKQGVSLYANAIPVKSESKTRSKYTNDTKIAFKSYKQDDEIVLDCDRNQPISKHRNKLGDIPNIDKLAFASEDDAYIDDDTLCKDIENGLLKINVNISNNDKKETIRKIDIMLKFSSTVKDFKAKLEPILNDLKLNLNKIQIKCGDEELNEEDHIFSYKKQEDFKIDVIILNDINKKAEIYYFKFPDNEVRGFEFNPNTTFSKINKMEEFSKQNYSFFIKDSEINQRSKISEYDGAKEKSAPIQLRINYFILVAIEGSNNDPKDYHHPFASDQTIGDVLDEYAQVVSDRRIMKYNNREYDEETKLSEIDYKKDQPLKITILPAEYSFVIEYKGIIREEFKLRLNADLTIKKLIRKIQKKKGINHDLEIYTGTRMDRVNYEETDTVSDFPELEKIIIKKVEPQYEITFNGKTYRKSFDVNCTVADLLNSNNKKYKLPNERQKTIARHKEEILPDDKFLCELYPRKITIELLDPVYQFKLEGKDPIKISIPDDSNYDEAINIVKEKIKEIEEIENERIEFQLKDFLFDYETRFGPEISQENPIIIKILDPDYNWIVKETEDDDGKDEDFSFPAEFTIGDAIKEIEKKFENKCSIKILQKSKTRITQIKDKVNIYENYYNNPKVHIYVQKCPIKFIFAVNDEKFEKEFNNDDKIIHIANHLRLKDKKLSFSESSSDESELNEKLEFEYKGKKFNSTATFDSLNYQPYEEDKIQINLIEDKNCFFDNEDEKMQILIDKIGEGATSNTFKIFDIVREKTMCKKVLKYGKDKTIKDLQNAIKESQFLQSVNHPCICDFYGINTIESIKTEIGDEVTTVALFLEFLEYDLSECLMKNLLNNSMKTRIVVEICHGMLYIHKLGCIHRDLKIQNIMLNSTFHAKIIDFSYSYINESLFDNVDSDSKKSLSKGIGTMDYMSPEMLNEENYDNKTDVYSFGIVLYYIFVGSKPNYKMKDKMLGKPIQLPEPSNSISQFCLDLIEKCTQTNPDERPSFDEILNELRINSFKLADDIDEKYVSKRDNELK